MEYLFSIGDALRVLIIDHPTLPFGFVFRHWSRGWQCCVWLAGAAGCCLAVSRAGTPRELPSSRAGCGAGGGTERLLARAARLCRARAFPMCLFCALGTAVDILTLANSAGSSGSLLPSPSLPDPPPSPAFCSLFRAPVSFLPSFVCNGASRELRAVALCSHCPMHPHCPMLGAGFGPILGVPPSHTAVPD